MQLNTKTQPGAGSAPKGGGGEFCDRRILVGALRTPANEQTGLMHAFPLECGPKMDLNWLKDANKADGEAKVGEDPITWSWLSSKKMSEEHRQTLHVGKPVQELPSCVYDQFHPPQAVPFKDRLVDISLYRDFFVCWMSSKGQDPG